MPDVSSTYLDQSAFQCPTTTDAIAALYDAGLHACLRGDRSTLRSALADLVAEFDEPANGGSRQAVHTFCLQQSAIGDLATVYDLLDGLRETWVHDGTLRQAA